MKQREHLINDYIRAYNEFDINGMLKNLDAAIKFVNISNGEVNMTINGLPAFKSQAEQAASFFKSREQSVTGIDHRDEETEVDIAYKAILAIDLPNGLKSGDELNLSGRSIFKFSGDKITEITDIS